VRASDEESYREFVTAQWSPLGRLAYLLVGDTGHAEDLVQIVFTKVWFVWGRIRDQAPEAYARRVLTNTATSWWRRRWHSERPTSELPDRVALPDLAADVAMTQSLAAALRSLPARQRTAVVLRFAEDLSEAQVAGVMNCSVGNVKSLTSRGLARLRECGVVEPSTAGELTNGVAS
jgi:RNA polymerase sigma-70 factor (sigma-E family)